MIRKEWLEVFAVRVRLLKTEWRVVAIVLASPGPITARQIAKRLGLDYSRLKRVVRELVRWRILCRRAEGLVFQPDADQWGPPT